MRVKVFVMFVQAVQLLMVPGPRRIGDQVRDVMVRAVVQPSFDGLDWCMLGQTVLQYFAWWLVIVGLTRLSAAIEGLKLALVEVSAKLEIDHVQNLSLKGGIVAQELSVSESVAHLLQAWELHQWLQERQAVVDLGLR
jgi:hypothetical protein